MKFSTDLCGIRAILVTLALLFMGGCSSTTVDLPYSNTAAQSQTAAAASNSVKILSVVDRRKHDPHWLGAIRGGFGNPLKTLTTDMPVSTVVERAFTSALDSRGLLAPTVGDYGLQVIVNQFDCNQYARREAHVRFAVSLVESASGQQVYAKDVKVDKVTGSRLTLDAGVFADVEDLRMVANQALQEAIDDVLNDPQFAESIGLGV